MTLLWTTVSDSDDDQRLGIHFGSTDGDIWVAVPVTEPRLLLETDSLAIGQGKCPGQQLYSQPTGLEAIPANVKTRGSYDARRKTQEEHNRQRPRVSLGGSRTCRAGRLGHCNRFHGRADPQLYTGGVAC
jgi:hypothetical protein